MDSARMGGADPFRALSEADPPPAAAGQAAEPPRPESCAPIRLAEPPEAPQIRHPEHGAATMRWTYRNAAGAPLFAVARFDFVRADGTADKTVLPYCYGRDGGRTGWRFKAPPDPRPLYGLERLAARPDAPVLLVEGEKTADAAAALFPEFVPITSQGGANAAAKADWTPLRGRKVIIWPDHDEPGRSYAASAAELLNNCGAASVRIVAVPADWPNGWDLADPQPGSAGTETLHALLAEAPDRESAKPPAGFRLTKEGLVFSKDDDLGRMWLAAEFEVLAETCDQTGCGWGLLLRWRDRDNRPHQWAMPRRLVHADGNAIAAELEDAGLPCATGRQRA